MADRFGEVLDENEIQVSRENSVRKSNEKAKNFGMHN